MEKLGGVVLFTSLSSKWKKEIMMMAVNVLIFNLLVCWEVLNEAPACILTIRTKSTHT